MPDSHVGAIIKSAVKQSFRIDFDARPNDYVDGKISAKELRCLFTKWVADAVADLYTNQKHMIRTAFDKCGISIDLDGHDKHKIVIPNFDPYCPPEIDEEFRDEPYTPEEIREFEKKEIAERKKGERTRNENEERNKSRETRNGRRSKFK